MTASDSPTENRAEDTAPAITPGIYLEEKHSTIGTGGTAKSADYRTFWVTLTVGETSAVLVLLDDDFHPTPIRETFSIEKLKGPGWHYIAEGQKRYALLRPHLDRMMAPPAPVKPAAAPKAKGGNWWEGGGGQAAPAAKKKPAPAAKKNNWWE